MTTALVMAGRSFLGQALSLRMRELGVHVLETTRGAPEPNVHHCDMTDHGAVESLVAAVRPDWIVQCAGAKPASNRAELQRLHEGGARALLSALARHCPQTRVVLFGSAAEYGAVGPDRFPIREDCVPGTLQPYGASKLAQTQLAAALVAKHGLMVATVRPFNVIGPGSPSHYFAGAIGQRLMGMRREGLTGPFTVANPDCTRDFIDVRDVADAVVGVLLGPMSAGAMAIYNIATGLETTLGEVAAYLGQLAGGFFPVKEFAPTLFANVKRSCGDAARLGRELGWKPRHNWQESVRAMWHRMLTEDERRARVQAAS